MRRSGLRNVIREWTPWRGRSLDVALALFALAAPPLGLRAAAAVYLARGDLRMIRASHTQPGFLAALLHRLAGIALAIFLPMHFWALAAALNGADASTSSSRSPTRRW